MDEATARLILKNYGATDNAPNMQRVMQQNGPTDAILAKSMGLQGAVGEEGNALSRLAFASERPAPVAQAPVEQQWAPEAQAAAPVARGMPTAKPAAPSIPTPDPFNVTPQSPSAPAPAPGPSTGFPWWLLAALGAMPRNKSMPPVSPGRGDGDPVPRGGNDPRLPPPAAAAVEVPKAADRTGQLALPAPTDVPMDIMGNVTGANNNSPLGVPPRAQEAVDKISKDTERPSTHKQGPESRKPAKGPATGSGVAMTGKEMVAEPLPDIKSGANIQRPADTDYSFKNANPADYEKFRSLPPTSKTTPAASNVSVTSHPDAKKLSNMTYIADPTFPPTDLRQQGISPEYVNQLESMGLATNGRMSSDQYMKLDGELNRARSTAKAPSLVEEVAKTIGRVHK